MNNFKAIIGSVALLCSIQPLAAWALNTESGHASIDSQSASPHSSQGSHMDKLNYIPGGEDDDGDIGPDCPDKYLTKQFKWKR